MWNNALVITRHTFRALQRRIFLPRYPGLLVHQIDSADYTATALQEKGGQRSGIDPEEVLATNKLSPRFPAEPERKNTESPHSKHKRRRYE